MSEVLTKIIEWVTANPSAASSLLVAVALMLIAAAPIAALALVGYALHALAPRQKGEGE